MATAYIAKSRTYLLFRLQLFVLVLAAFASITFHILLSKHAVVSHNLIHTLYAAYHSLLYLDLFLYLVYIKETMHLGRKTLLRLIVPVGGITLLVIALEFLSVPFDWGLHITDSGAISDGANLFYIGYPLLCAAIFYLLIRYRKRIYKQVMRGIFGSSVISFVILFIQMFFGVTSYTVATFLFPALAVLYLMHSNPYDLEMGADTIEPETQEGQFFHTHRPEPPLQAGKQDGAVLLQRMHVPHFQHFQRLPALVVVPFRPAMVIAEFLVRTAIDCLSTLQAQVLRLFLYHFVLHTHPVLDAQK